MQAQPAYYGTLALNVLGHYGILISTGLPYWRYSSWQISDPLYGRIPTFDGIWWQCMSLKAGGFTCNNYGKPSLFIDPVIQAARGLMVVSCILTFFAMLINMIIIDSCIMLPRNWRTRFILALTCAVFLLVSCLCCLIATAYYAWKITYEFHSPLFSEREFTYMYGACLYVIWIAMFFEIISAVLLIVGACKDRRSRNVENFPEYPPSFAMPDFMRPPKPDDEYI